ncbi:hypothetical protein [Streptomyces sp. NPDC088707]|uniref:hypothetical protein n=1 Tax=Streptomyces sp. NPDC088707 TaxID=3365871 RepID=UPI003816BD13
MSQSTSSRRGTEWMDRENRFRRSWNPDTVFQEVSPELHLLRLRNSFNETGLAYKPSRGRRVCLYVRTLPGLDAEPFFERLRAEARTRGWQAGQEFHDDQGPQAPMQSIGWLQVRKHIREGFSDGVIVTDRFHISRDGEQYIDELRFVHESLGVTVLLVPEAPT